MSIILNDNIDTRANKPTDNRYGPHTSTAVAIAAVPSYQRYVGLTVGIGSPVIEYWFESGITDLDLVQKISAGNVENLTAGSGISITGTATNPTIAVTTPTQLTTNLSTDIIGDASDSTKYPSVKAIKDYADSLVVGLLNDRGHYPASATSPGNYPSTGGSGGGTILKGDIWFISSAGYLNLIPVAVGASVRALKNSPGILTDADWDIIDTGLGFVPENSDNRVLNASGITANPTSTSNYVSVNALTDYLTSNPPATPTLQQVLAATPSQTSIGYNMILADISGNSTTIDTGDIYLSNGTSDQISIVTSTSPAITITSATNLATYSTTGISLSDISSGGSMDITASGVVGAQSINFPNASGTLVTSINGSYTADSTGNVSLPFISGSGSPYTVPRWDATASAFENSNIFDDGANSRMGIFTTSPRGGASSVQVGDAGGTMLFPYETLIVERTGDTKFGVYTSVNAVSSGAAYVLGNTNYINTDGFYPGFEYQFVTQSTGQNSYVRYNYIQRNASGTVVSNVDNILNIYGDGSIVMQPTSTAIGYPLNTRFVINASRFSGSPSTKLYVDGEVEFNSGAFRVGSLSSSPFTNAIITSDINGYLGTQTISTGTENKVAKWTSTGVFQFSDSIIYDDGTRVGIGTVLPGYTLDVEGSANFLLSGNTPPAPFGNKFSIRNGMLRIGIDPNTIDAARFIQFTNEADTGGSETLYIGTKRNQAPENGEPVIGMGTKNALHINSGNASTTSPIILGTTVLTFKADGRVRYVPLPSAPTADLEIGDTYYDSGLNKLRVYTNTGWQDLN